MSYPARAEGLVNSTIEDLAMWKVCEKILPKLLNDDQGYYIQVCQDIIKHLQTEANLLCRVITGDKKRTWVLARKQVPVEVWHHWGQRKTVKVNSQSHVDHVLWCERNCPQRVLAAGPDDQSTSWQGPEHPAVLNWKEHHCTGTTSLFIWSYSV